MILGNSHPMLLGILQPMLIAPYRNFIRSLLSRSRGFGFRPADALAREKLSSGK